MSPKSASNPLTEAVFYILLALQTPLHGYGIMQFVENISGGKVQLGSGTLYGAINSLLKKGYIEVHNVSGDNRGKKEYIITDLGQSIAIKEQQRLQHLAHTGKEILKLEVQ